MFDSVAKRLRLAAEQLGHLAYETRSLNRGKWWRWANVFEHDDIVLGDNVMLGANACVMGPVKIGDDVRIGAAHLWCRTRPRTRYSLPRRQRRCGPERWSALLDRCLFSESRSFAALNRGLESTDFLRYKDHPPELGARVVQLSPEHPWKSRTTSPSLKKKR